MFGIIGALARFFNPFSRLSGIADGVAEGAAGDAIEEAFADNMQSFEPLKPFIQVHPMVDHLVSYNDLGDYNIRDLYL